MNNLILTTEKNKIFTIILNRSDKKNALSSAMYHELCQHFEYVNNNNNIHCLVIRGDENCFCAGNDLHDFLQCSPDDELVALEFVKVLANFTKPLIAGVAGVAVGIGTTLLLHCDMVIAADNAHFKLPFTQLGLCPEAGSSLLLTRLVGQNRAFELMVLGKSFNAEKAYQYGLVNEVCQANELIQITEATALNIAQLPNDAVMTSRRLIKQATQSVVNDVINDEGTEFARLINTPACKTILGKFFR
ncbi:enoyl-CoA hydratase-related protein [Colwellia asteriadis]|uniref:Enoyl-CoA hydratase-related protein n=1 Tax=Colwellia asteriadis TaxID=517723 RepID=A0ABN1L3J7_9GAMM